MLVGDIRAYTYDKLGCFRTVNFYFVTLSSIVSAQVQDLSENFTVNTRKQGITQLIDTPRLSKL